MAEPKAGKRRSVATRVLLSYVGIVLAFALSTGWSVSALSQAAREAKMVRSGYLPLALALGELVAQQDLHNTQLNHITSARNPADIRMWFDFAKQGAPKKFAEVRARIHSSLGAAPDAATRTVGAQIAQLTVGLEARTERDAQALGHLFEAIEQRQPDRAEALRDGLARSGLGLKNDLRALQDRVERTVEELHQQATLRERRAIQLLIGLSVLALVVGVLMAAYAQRVLRPLGVVTERANSVAEGDLTPRAVVATNDEIGELARTFESMVAKIAEANRQLLMTERLATIGKMAAHVTHEVRNPLSSIALNLELLQEELGGGNAEVKNLLQAIQREVERLTALSEQYLSMARKQPPELLPEDLQRIVEATLAFSRPELERSGVEVVFHPGERLPSLQLDEAQVRQALLNLLRNARESMPSGGKLEIRLGVVSGKVELCVKDTGEGMAPGTLERLFEPFFTTKGRGTGLGLAVVKQIVTAHGARIECTSSRGEGTEFRITFEPQGGSPS
jgi:two-component system NtrC family sensor kinase